MKMKVTSPEVTFNPVTVELTFESLEELLVLKAAIGIACGDDVYRSIKGDGQLPSNLDAHHCGSIAYEQYKFFQQVLAKVKR